MTKGVIAYFLLSLMLPSLLKGQDFQSEKGHVEFHSTVPLHSFTGKSDHLTGKISLSDSTVDFYVDVHSLKTGIGKRDRDMLKTLDAEEHPFAAFYGKIVSGFTAESRDPQKVTVEGDLTIHGITHNVSITGTLQQTNSGLKVNATWTLNMKDYQIKPPGILFYRVSENVDISLSAMLSPM
ncbi:MAG: YceI family protein [Balneolaceae bacterium]